MPEASEIKEEEANEVTQPITDKESNKFAKIIRAKNKINIFSLKPRLSIQTAEGEKEEEFGISLAMLLNTLRSRGKTEYINKTQAKSSKRVAIKYDSSDKNISLNSKVAQALNSNKDILENEDAFIKSLKLNDLRDSSCSSKKSIKLNPSRLEEKDSEYSESSSNKDIKHKNIQKLLFRDRIKMSQNIKVEKDSSNNFNVMSKNK